MSFGFKELTMDTGEEMAVEAATDEEAVALIEESRCKLLHAVHTKLNALVEYLPSGYDTIVTVRKTLNDVITAVAESNVNTAHGANLDGSLEGMHLDALLSHLLDILHKYSSTFARRPQSLVGTETRELQMHIELLNVCLMFPMSKGSRESCADRISCLCSDIEKRLQPGSSSTGHP